MDEQVAGVAAQLAALRLASCDGSSGSPTADAVGGIRTPTPIPRSVSALPAPWPQNARRSPLTPLSRQLAVAAPASAPSAAPPSTVRRRAKSAWNVFQEAHKHLKWTRAEMAEAWTTYKDLQVGVSVRQQHHPSPTRQHDTGSSPSHLLFHTQQKQGVADPSLAEYRSRSQQEQRQRELDAELALAAVERPRRESISDARVDAVLAPLTWSSWTRVAPDTVSALRAALGAQHGVYEWAYGEHDEDDKENAGGAVSPPSLTCFYVGRGGGGGAADGLRARFNKYVRDGDAFYSDRAAGSGGAKHAFWRRVQLDERRRVYFRYCATPPDAAKRAEEAMLAAFDYLLNSEGNGLRRVNGY
jgi:hypothetical protein